MKACDYDSIILYWSLLVMCRVHRKCLHKQVGGDICLYYSTLFMIWMALVLISF